MWNKRIQGRRKWDLVGYLFRAYFTSRQRWWFSLPILSKKNQSAFVGSTFSSQSISFSPSFLVFPLQMRPDDSSVTRSQRCQMHKSRENYCSFKIRLRVSRTKFASYMNHCHSSQYIQENWLQVASATAQHLICRRDTFWIVRVK